MLPRGDEIPGLYLQSWSRPWAYASGLASPGTSDLTWSHRTLEFALSFLSSHTNHIWGKKYRCFFSCLHHCRESLHHLPPAQAKPNSLSLYSACTCLSHTNGSTSKLHPQSTHVVPSCCSQLVPATSISYLDWGNSLLTSPPVSTLAPCSTVRHTG